MRERPGVTPAPPAVVAGRPSRIHLGLLAFIVLFGAGLRLLWINEPLLDAHRWRQVDTAGIARSLYEDRFNVFYPQVNWGGERGYVESEFPLLPAIVAAIYRVTGEQPWVGRAIVMVFSTAMIAAVFGVGLELFGAGGALAAAFLVAVSPAAVFFGRTFMPDSIMLCGVAAALWAFLVYFRTRSLRALMWGSVSMALACLVKLPAVMMLAPIAGAAWLHRGTDIFRDRRLLLAIAVPLLITVAWYTHAFFLYERTGLTFGILVQPARTYPPSIAPGPWNTAFAKWSNIRVLGDPNYYWTLLLRLYQLLLLPWGFAGALIGLVVWRSRSRVVADLWLLAMVAFVLVMGEANIGHEYYQLPMVPIAALYFGGFLAPALNVLDADAGARLRPSSLARAGCLAIVLGVVGYTSFYYSGVINSHFRPDNLDVRVRDAGRALNAATQAGSLIVVVDDYGVTSPLLLYYAHRKGWSFDVENLSPEVIAGLEGKGGRYFATTVWSRIEAVRPEVARYLQQFRQLDLPDAPRDSVAFDLLRR